MVQMTMSKNNISNVLSHSSEYENCLKYQNSTSKVIQSRSVKVMLHAGAGKIIHSVPILELNILNASLN